MQSTNVLKNFEKRLLNFLEVTNCETKLIKLRCKRLRSTHYRTIPTANIGKPSEINNH